MFSKFIEQTRHLVHLNPIQQQAASHIEGPMLVLASPGSGKTTTMIMRIAYLISHVQVASNRIIAVSFSKASASDMEERYHTLFPHLQRVTFSTIHSLAFHIVRYALNKRGIAYVVIDGYQDQWNDQETQSDLSYEHRPISKHRLLTELFHAVNGTMPKEEQMEELTTYISYIKNKMLPRSSWDNIPCNVRNAAQIMELYEAKKRENANQLCLDFDDMLMYAEHFLREDLQLREYYKKRFDYVLSDESQDTSLVQHSIIAWLVEDHLNLFVVADDDQAIYSWRGAEPSYLLQFKEVYANAKILYMEQNYRSSKNIVAASNSFIKRNKHRYEKDMFTTNPVSRPIVIMQHEQVADEVVHIVEAIKQEHNLAEVAILYRNHSSSLLFIHELSRQQIPFYMKDADDKFFKHWIVEDILNIMRLSYSDKIFELFEKTAIKLSLYLSKDQLIQLKQAHRNESLFQLAQEQLPLPAYQKQRLIDVSNHIQSLKSLTPYEALLKIRSDLAYEKTIHEIADKFGFQKEYVMNILNTLQQIAESLATLPQFAERLKELERLQAEAKHRKKRAAVTLSTLHSAKGLEFDTVHMIDLVQNVIPSRNELGEIEQIEEATRLFYVGMTRARHQLVLHTLQKWQGVHAQPSMFVEDVKKIIGSATRSSSTQGSIVKSDAAASIVQDAWSLSDQLITKASELIIGQEVEHKQFGHGILNHIEENKISIHFSVGGSKTLVKEIVIRQGLLRKATKQQIDTSIIT